MIESIRLVVPTSGERSGQRWRVSAGRFGGSFWDGENFVNLDCGGICTTL